jgi:hypothetical protein
VVRERIANASATAWALNGGAAWEPAPLPRLRLSASIHNLGTSPSFKIDEVPGEPVKLPTAMQLGASYSIPAGGFDWHPSIESRMTRGRNASAWWTRSDMSRAPDWKSLPMNDESTSLSYGVGCARQAMRFDYAFVPVTWSGDTHRSWRSSSSSVGRARALDG